MTALPLSPILQVLRLAFNIYPLRIEKGGISDEIFITNFFLRDFGFVKLRAHLLWFY